MCARPPDRETKKQECRLPVRAVSLARGRCVLGLLVLAVLAAALTGCGTDKAKPTAPVAAARTAAEPLLWPAASDAVVARVGQNSISGATFNRVVQAQLSSAAPSERLDPPRFDSCIAQLRVEAQSVGGPQPG